MKDDNTGLVIFDLDNTLVDKNTVFEKAQKKMIEIVKGSKATKEDMKKLREMDLIFIKKKKNHLYPFEILALSLWFYYNKNLDVRESTQRSLDIFQNTCKRTEELKKAVNLAQKAAAEHNNILENTPAPLFRGVKKVLQTLKKRGYILVLVSESNSALQEKTLKTYNLQRYFDDIRFCSQKNNVFLR
jgi:FMN phosphatase YigB (HAD superfamily)